MTLNLNSKEAYKKMTEASDEWSKWQEKEIVLDEGRKAMFSKCVIRFKSECKSIAEAEHKARTDLDYQEVVKSYAHAAGQLIKAKLNYNNLDRYVSLRQSEVKRDLTLAGKQEG